MWCNFGFYFYYEDIDFLGSDKEQYLILGEYFFIIKRRKIIIEGLYKNLRNLKDKKKFIFKKDFSYIIKLKTFDNLLNLSFN